MKHFIPHKHIQLVSERKKKRNYTSWSCCYVSMNSRILCKYFCIYCVYFVGFPFECCVYISRWIYCICLMFPSEHNDTSLCAFMHPHAPAFPPRSLILPLLFQWHAFNVLYHYTFNIVLKKEFNKQLAEKSFFSRVETQKLHIFNCFKSFKTCKCTCKR